MHDQAPTRSPSHPTMGGVFDKLVESVLAVVQSNTVFAESNMALVKTMRMAIFVMISLTAVAIGMAVYSAIEMRSLVTKVTTNCGKTIQQ